MLYPNMLFQLMATHNTRWHSLFNGGYTVGFVLFNALNILSMIR